MRRGWTSTISESSIKSSVATIYPQPRLTSSFPFPPQKCEDDPPRIKDPQRCGTRGQDDCVGDTTCVPDHWATCTPDADCPGYCVPVLCPTTPQSNMGINPPDFPDPDPNPDPVRPRPRRREICAFGSNEFKCADPRDTCVGDPDFAVLEHIELVEKFKLGMCARVVGPWSGRNRDRCPRGQMRVDDLSDDCFPGQGSKRCAGFCVADS